MQNEDDNLLLMQMLLHAADISNPAKPFKIAVCWVDRVLQEFTAQGDLEKSINVPVSPMCDREAISSVADVADLQINFINYVVSPLFIALSKYFRKETTFSPLQWMEENINKWESLRKKDCKEDEIRLIIPVLKKLKERNEINKSSDLWSHMINKPVFREPHGT